MNSSEKRLITFIAWSGAILGSISMIGYIIVGYWLDATYGLIALFFFFPYSTLPLYSVLVSTQHHCFLVLLVSFLLP